MKQFLLLCSLAFFFGCAEAPTQETTTTDTITTSAIDYGLLKAKLATKIPVIDGKAEDDCWKEAAWRPLDQLWIGEAPTKEDYRGRYKLAWSEAHLYVLAEIQDDTLIDIHPDGLDRYWDDDCLEIFVDEDRSKGNHQYNHNAFAYHIALDGQVADVGRDSAFRYYPHCISERTQNGNTTIWEVAVSIYDDTYVDDSNENQPVQLVANKKMGFALAYCDNDHSEQRENFMGSTIVEGEDKNRGWIDAGVFAELVLE